MQIHFLSESAEDPEQPFRFTYLLFLKNYLVIHSMNIEPPNLPESERAQKCHKNYSLPPYH